MGGGSDGVDLFALFSFGTLIMFYRPGMKINHKYAFLHAFFSWFSATFSNAKIYDHHRQKDIFFQILDVFAPLNDVRA